MNNIRQIQELNKRELENGVSPEASWHADYRDTAYIYIGGLDFKLSEGDVVTIFSQFGEPTYINLMRDKETGKSKGFAFLKYEDQRSTDLAVDNLGGTQLQGRVLRVDHTRYKKKEGEKEEGHDLTTVYNSQNEAKDAEDTEDSEKEQKKSRPRLKEERELEALIMDHDDDDPMKAFMIEEKKEELALALAAFDEEKHAEKRDKKRHHRHREHKSHRSSRHDHRRESPGRAREESSRRHRSRSREHHRGQDSKDRREEKRVRRSRSRDRSPHRGDRDRRDRDRRYDDDNKY